MALLSGFDTSEQCERAVYCVANSFNETNPSTQFLAEETSARAKVNVFKSRATLTQPMNSL